MTKGGSVSGEVSARDRVHIKLCGGRCAIESDRPDDACKNLDFLLDQVEREANGKENP